MISGVGYVKISDNIEYEWYVKTYDVSAGVYNLQMVLCKD